MADPPLFAIEADSSRDPPSFDIRLGKHVGFDSLAYHVIMMRNSRFLANDLRAEVSSSFRSRSPWRRNAEPILEILLATSVAVQGVGLARLSGFSGFIASAFAAGSVVLAIVVVAAWRRRGRYPHLDTLLVAVALGGGGMFIGGLIDGVMPAQLHGASMMQHHSNHAEIGALLGSWSTWLMILFCVPICWLFCDRPCHDPSKTRAALGHGVVCGCMLAGMFLGGLWLGPLVIWITGSQAVGAHLGMTAGMVVGTALGLWISTAKHHDRKRRPRSDVRPNRRTDLPKTFEQASDLSPAKESAGPTGVITTVLCIGMSAAVAVGHCQVDVPNSDGASSSYQVRVAHVGPRGPPFSSPFNKIRQPREEGSIGCGG